MASAVEFFARDEHVSTVSVYVREKEREREREREHLHAWFQSNAHDIHIVTGVRNVSRETWPVHDFIWWRDTGLQEITRKYAQPLLSTGTKQEIFFSRFHLEWRSFHWWTAIRDSPPWFLIRFAERNRWLFDVRFFDFSSFIRYSSLDRIELLIFFVCRNERISEIRFINPFWEEMNEFVKIYEL